MQSKLFVLYLVLFLGTAARAQQQSSPHQHPHLLRSSHEEDHRSLITLDGSVTACIEVKDGSTKNGNAFILGDCTNHEYGIDEICADKDDEDCRVLMYRTRQNPSKCMQASHGASNQKSVNQLKVGSWLRVYPCDPLNRLQHFVRVLGDEIQVKGSSSPKLYLSYRGVNPNVNQDQILLKKCSDIGEDGWSYD
jgi:hypothetical protein